MYLQKKGINQREAKKLAKRVIQMLYCVFNTQNIDNMIYTRILIIILFFSFLSTFSQEINKNSTIIKQLEGVTVSYTNSGSDCIFHINNRSGNPVKLSWDTKVFYSETDSKEIHKEYIIPPYTNEKKSLLRASNVGNNLGFAKGANGTITRIEIHNFDFKGVL